VHGYGEVHEWIRGRGAYGCGGRAHTADWGRARVEKGARTGREGDAYGREGGCARVMGRVRTGYGKGAHGWGGGRARR
jgi:hypothetical protein